MRSVQITTPAATPLLDIGTVGRQRHVFVKDDSVLPSGTFKDRLSAAVLAVPPRDVVDPLSMQPSDA